MRTLKRLGGVLIALVALTVMLTGTALAAEPAAQGIGVQLNGESLTFKKAAPEIVGSRTFVPFRAVMEAMGAEVGYDAQTRTVSAQRDGITITMVPGQKEMTVTENGQTRTVTMKAAPYIKASNGRTYAPIRYAAEALGCNVGWDARTRTVIIVDVDTLFGDATFDLMDNFSAYCKKQQKSQNMTMTGALALDVEDKSGEVLPKPVSAKGSVDGIVGDKGIQMNWNLKLSGLSDLLADLSNDPLEQMVMQQMITALSDLKGEVRMDLETGMAYLSAPAVLVGAEQDAWYSLDIGAYQAELLGALDMAQLTQLKEAGIREVLTAVIQAMPLDDSEYSYQVISQAVKAYVDMLSDQAFTKSGNTYKAKMLAEDFGNLEITLTQRGQDIVAVDIVMTASAEEEGSKLSMKMTEHAAPDKVTANISMTMEDSEISMKLSMDMTCLPTQKAPVVTPPSGVEITPIA